MTRKASKRKPKVTPKATSRRGKASRLMEEKHIGFETTDWENVTDAEVAMRDTLRHYGYFYDVKTAFKWASDWVKKHMPKSHKSFKAAEPWRVSMTAGGLARMHMNGAPLDEKRLNFLKKKIQETVEAGEQNLKSKKSEEVDKTPKRKSPMELVNEKTSDFIGETEAVLDKWTEAPEDYSMFDELQKIDAAYVTAKAVADYYAPIRDEIALLVSKKDKDLLEAYSHMPARQRSKYLKFLDALVTDAEKYAATKKAVRKTRKKKAPSVGAQVSKVKCLKDSAEHKIASISPTEIVGASELWLFNTKYRTMSRLVSSAKTGFTVKGTTVQDVDLEQSGKKKLRKPDEFFAETTKTTKAKLNKVYKSLTTKESATTGRINTDTIIFKAY